MGWGNCGDDSRGRPIGYLHSAICDAPDCLVEIHRGLTYACGGMHGNETTDDKYDFDSCENYFCSDHRNSPFVEHEDGTCFMPSTEFCIPCSRKIEKIYIDYPSSWISKSAIVESRYNKSQEPIDINRACRIENATNAIANWANGDSELCLADYLGWSRDEFLAFMTRKVIPDRILAARR